MPDIKTWETWRQMAQVHISGSWYCKGLDHSFSLSHPFCAHNDLFFLFHFLKHYTTRVNWAKYQKISMLTSISRITWNYSLFWLEETGEIWHLLLALGLSEIIWVTSLRYDWLIVAMETINQSYQLMLTSRHPSINNRAFMFRWGINKEQRTKNFTTKNW